MRRQRQVQVVATQRHRVEEASGDAARLPGKHLELAFLRQWRIYRTTMATAPVTVVETAAFIARAKGRMTDAERLALIDRVARAPEGGDLIEGGGGIRKLRFAIGGRGKSGGVRVIYYYHSEALPVFLLTVFAKRERDNLNQAEINNLARAAKAIPKSYGVKR